MNRLTEESPRSRNCEGLFKGDSAFTLSFVPEPVGVTRRCRGFIQFGLLLFQTVRCWAFSRCLGILLGFREHAYINFMHTSSMSCLCMEGPSGLGKNTSQHWQRCTSMRGAFGHFERTDASSRDCLTCRRQHAPTLRVTNRTRRCLFGCVCVHANMHLQDASLHAYIHTQSEASNAS